MARKRKPLPESELLIGDLSHDGRGVSHLDGRVVFVEGALPGETVLCAVKRRRKGIFEGQAVEIIDPSAHRVEPRCPHFGVCGGCMLQHLDYQQQIKAKENVLRESLKRIGGVEPQEWFAPLFDNPWGYRRKARLGIRDVKKKGGVLVGFRERKSSYITSLRECPILDPKISALLPALHELISALACRSELPQIEVATGEDAQSLVFRNLIPTTDRDELLLTRFAKEHGVNLYLQPGGIESVALLWPNSPKQLTYEANPDINISFSATDFIQVNTMLNQILVSRVLELVDSSKKGVIVDLFCGLGNFTLPLARGAGEVVGYEGQQVLVDRAMENAKQNSINNARFKTVDLYTKEPVAIPEMEHAECLLLDPPRSGAREVVEQLNRQSPKRILYISCNPATLARDAGILVNEKRYSLKGSGMIDMFPHTAHVESIALFERQ